MRAKWKRNAYFPKIATLISYEGILKAKQDHKTTESICFLRKHKSKLVTCDSQPVVAKISYKLLPEVGSMKLRCTIIFSLPALPRTTKIEPRKVADHEL